MISDSNSEVIKPLLLRREVAVQILVRQVRAPLRAAAAGPAAAHCVHVLRAVPNLLEQRHATIGAREAHAVAVEAPVP